MKPKKLFRLSAVMLCAALICAVFSGCAISVPVNIESVRIDVYGYGNGVAEITLAKDDYQNENDSISVSVSITWQKNTYIGNKLDVVWGFIGDDLGCKVSIIDPCCTKGTLAVVKPGDRAGKAVLRATAKSKNEISANLVIWIGQESQTPDTVGKFYGLREAYNKGLLTEADIRDTAFYFQGQPPYISSIYKPATPKNPEFLSAEAANKIKQAFLDDYYLNNGNAVIYSIDDISIESYCGTYNGAVVVYLHGLYGYYQAVWTDIIAGVPFYYRDGNYLRVFKEEEFFTITATAGEGGYISPSGTVSVAKDGSAVFSVYSYATNDSHGVKAVYVDGRRVDVLLLDVEGYIDN